MIPPPPLAVLVSITVAGIIILQDWRHIHFRSAGGLLIATLFGIPLGLLLLAAANEHALKIILAVLILAFSIYSIPPVRNFICKKIIRDGCWSAVFLQACWAGRSA